jgi:hypothetical protein
MAMVKDVVIVEIAAGITNRMNAIAVGSMDAATMLIDPARHLLTVGVTPVKVHTAE